MNKWLKLILLLAALLATFIGATLLTLHRVNSQLTPAELKSTEIAQYLDAYFIDDYDEHAMADAVADAMVEATGDRWSYYLPADEKAAYDEQMQNAYVGIGVTITLDEEAGGMRILSVTDGGPAAEAGLLPDDLVVAVEGQSTLALGMDETRAQVRGEEGTFVQLTIDRGGARFSVSVERRSIQTPVTTYEMLDGQIGYLIIENFDSRCAQETNDAIDALLQDGAVGLIFDVRFNGGGYKDELVQVLDKLLPEGDLFRAEDYSGQVETDTSDAACIELPMVVLVNEDSYSAAEFFAAALQEYGWASVVGTKTVGKGNFQTAFELSDGSLLNLSIGKYYTPQGRSLTDVGVTPDVEVTLDEQAQLQLYYGQLAQDEDAQLQAAIREIHRKIS